MPDMPQPDSSLFDDKNKVKAAFIKFTKIGDWFEGTLHEVRHVKNLLPGKEGETQINYDFIVKSGVFHMPDPLTKQAYADGSGVIILKKDDLWTMGGKPGIDANMRNIKVGQIFGARFSALKPSKTPGFAAQKVVDIFPGKMDETYMGTAVDSAAALGVPPLA